MLQWEGAYLGPTSVALRAVGVTGPEEEVGIDKVDDVLTAKCHSTTQTLHTSTTAHAVGPFLHRVMLISTVR